MSTRNKIVSCPRNEDKRVQRYQHQHRGLSFQQLWLPPSTDRRVNLVGENGHIYKGQLPTVPLDQLPPEIDPDSIDKEQLFEELRTMTFPAVPPREDYGPPRRIGGEYTRARRLTFAPIQVHPVDTEERMRVPVLGADGKMYRGSVRNQLQPKKLDPKLLGSKRPQKLHSKKEIFVDPTTVSLYVDGRMVTEQMPEVPVIQLPMSDLKEIISAAGIGARKVTFVAKSSAEENVGKFQDTFENTDDVKSPDENILDVSEEDRSDVPEENKLDVPEEDRSDVPEENRLDDTEESNADGTDAPTDESLEDPSATDGEVLTHTEESGSVETADEIATEEASFGEIPDNVSEDTSFTETTEDTSENSGLVEVADDAHTTEESEFEETAEEGPSVEGYQDEPSAETGEEQEGEPSDVAVEGYQDEPSAGTEEEQEGAPSDVTVEGSQDEPSSVGTEEEFETEEGPTEISESVDEEALEQEKQEEEK